MMQITTKEQERDANARQSAEAPVALGRPAGISEQRQDAFRDAELQTQAARRLDTNVDEALRHLKPPPMVDQVLRGGDLKITGNRVSTAEVTEQYVRQALDHVRSEGSNFSTDVYVKYEASRRAQASGSEVATEVARKQEKAEQAQAQENTPEKEAQREGTMSKQQIAQALKDLKDSHKHSNGLVNGIEAGTETEPQLQANRISTRTAQADGLASRGSNVENDTTISREELREAIKIHRGKIISRTSAVEATIDAMPENRIAMKLENSPQLHTAQAISEERVSQRNSIAAAPAEAMEVSSRRNATDRTLAPLRSQSALSLGLNLDEIRSGMRAEASLTA